MKCLIESFYRSTRNDKTVPIPHRQILLTARIMDKILAQLGQKQLNGFEAGQAQRYIG